MLNRSFHLEKPRRGDMKKLLLVIPLVFLFCFAFSCRRGEEATGELSIKPLSEDDIVAITALGPAIDKAAIEGDWNALVLMFTEDVLLMTPNCPAIEGRSSFLTWVDSLGIKISEHRVEFNEINGYGDIAYGIASYFITIRIEGAEDPIKDEGKILAILLKQPDDSWLIAVWSWNSDLPFSK
jgi:ketosteroid isomerase-like protein